MYMLLKMQERLFLMRLQKADKNEHAAKNPGQFVPGKASECLRMHSFWSKTCSTGKEHACCYCSWSQGAALPKSIR